jgi:hypothetical protein
MACWAKAKPIGGKTPADSVIPGTGKGPNAGTKVAGRSRSPSVIGVPVNESGIPTVGLFQSTPKMVSCGFWAIAVAERAKTARVTVYWRRTVSLCVA